MYISTTPASPNINIQNYKIVTEAAMNFFRHHLVTQKTKLIVDIGVNYKW
jgi:hypothetical protein